MKQILTGFFLILLGINAAFAVSLKEAKSSGLVGERNDGYLGYVVTPPSDEVKAVVKGVNNKRRTKFSESAKGNNLQTDQVANQFYQRAIGATAKGNYYQDANGTWVKK
jgi:uncharacterized protein YdbL (DUF1318 family)